MINKILIKIKLYFFIVVKLNYLNKIAGFYQKNLCFIISQIFFNNKVSNKYYLINF